MRNPVRRRLYLCWRLHEWTYYIWTQDQWHRLPYSDDSSISRCFILLDLRKATITFNTDVFAHCRWKMGYYFIVSTSNSAKRKMEQRFDCHIRLPFVLRSVIWTVMKNKMMDTNYSAYLPRAGHRLARVLRQTLIMGPSMSYIWNL